MNLGGNLDVNLGGKTHNFATQRHVNACWDTATARRHWTKQWRHEQAGRPRHPLPNRTEFIIFKEILSTMTPVSVRIFFWQLTRSVMVMFFLLKSFY